MKTHLRNNTMSLMTEWKDYDGKTEYLTMNEWWNGEGVDAFFGEKHIPLSITQATALVAGLINMGMVDIQECQQCAESAQEDMLEKQRRIKAIRDDQ